MCNLCIMTWLDVSGSTDPKSVTMKPADGFKQETIQLRGVSPTDPSHHHGPKWDYNQQMRKNDKYTEQAITFQNRSAVRLATTLMLP